MSAIEYILKKHTIVIHKKRLWAVAVAVVTVSASALLLVVSCV